MPIGSSQPNESPLAERVRALGLGDAFRRVLLAPLLVGGAALLINQAARFRRQFWNADDGVERVRRLSRAVLGNDKHAVAAVLGPPQAASAEAVFLADTWYYRIDGLHRIAMAVEFRDDVACDVRVLHIEPRPSGPAGLRGTIGERRSKRSV